MRKLIIISMLVIGLAMGGNALACRPGQCEEGPRNADVNLQFQATSDDGAKSSTGWRGNYNDNAGAQASGYAGGTLDVHANADGTFTAPKPLKEWDWSWGFFSGLNPKNYTKYDNPAIADGYAKAASDSKAWAYTKDFGTTSIAGAGAKTDGSAFTSGTAIGLKGCKEYVQGDVYVGGSVYQFNEAGETGYRGGSFVTGGNESGGNFYSSDYDQETGRGYVHDTNFIKGGMITKGHTEVSIDPRGNHRSIDAMTTNMVQVNAPGFDSSVFGNGGVAGVAQKGGTYAGGNANFSYNGNTYGNGNATLGADINVGSHSSTVSVSGHAFSISDGNGNVPQ